MTKVMSDRADEPSEQSPIKRLGELEVIQFINDAVRSGQRAILVTGRGQVSVRVPEAALAACSSASARTLHIGPPLPEPPELQEMIGAAVGIAGGRELSPQVMAVRLLFADPWRTAILAIDDAHTLSHRSLSYLSLMTELLAPDAPVLQIVLAAGPALLDTLAQPEFESLRKRLFRPGFETFRTLHRGEADGAFSDPRKRALGRAATRPTHVRNVEPVAASPRDYGIARPAVYAAAGLVAMGCVAAIGYIAFPAFSAGPTPPHIPSVNSAAPQEFLAPSDRSQSSAQLDPRQTGEVVDPLIDELVDAVASGSVEFADLEASVTPDALKLLIATPDRFATRASAAAAAGRVDEARRLEQFARLAYSARGRPDLLTASKQRSSQSLLRATSGVSAASAIGDPPRQSEAEQTGVPPNGSALSAEQLDAAGNGDRAASSPNAVAPAPPSAAPDQDIEGSRPAVPATAGPTAPPAALSAEQPGAAGNRDRAALSPDAAAPAAPVAAPDQNGDAAPPVIMARAAPTAPDGPTAPLVAGLPTLAPVRVVLNVARDDIRRAGRAAEIQQALIAAGLGVAELVPVDAQRSGPSIGYYFQSDRNAAAGVSHLLEPLLGAVDPVVLRKRGSIPEPGTIEIAIP